MSPLKPCWMSSRNMTPATIDDRRDRISALRSQPRAGINGALASRSGKRLLRDSGLS